MQEFVWRIESKLLESLLHIEHGHRGHEVQVRFDRTHEGAQLIQFLSRLCGGIAAFEFKRTEAGLDHFGPDPTVRIVDVLPICVQLRNSLSSRGGRKGKKRMSTPSIVRREKRGRNWTWGVSG